MLFSMIMGSHTILTLNVKGLNSPFKRVSILDFLHRHKIDIALLQETHLRPADVRRMQNKHYKPIVASGDGSHTKGVLILMKRNIALQIERVSTDNTGRLAFCCTTVQGQRVAFVSIYAPTKYEANFFPNLAKELLSLTDHLLVIGADMNTFFDKHMDRSHSSISMAQDAASKALGHFSKSLNLIDIWRINNPTTKDFTFYSAAHKMSSRIDYFLSSAKIAHCIKSINILPRYLSDHNPIILSYDLFPIRNKPTRWRFNTTLLQNEEYIAQLKLKLEEFININVNSVSNPMFVWAAVKGFLRDNAISFCTHLKKIKEKQIKGLELECHNLEQELNSNYSEQKDISLKLKQSELNDLIKQRVEYLMHITKHKYYSEGSKPTRLLALTLKKQEKQMTISAVRDPHAGIVTTIPAINNTFKDFFSSLYTSECSPTPNQFDSFFQNIKLPGLSTVDTEKLEAPITLEELFQAVKLTNMGRSPGIDGLPAELYLSLWEMLGPLWLDALNFALDEGSLLKDLNTALISVLPKPGKDHLECANYRPISLINADLKIFAKALALRLEKVVCKLIHLDQTGFMKGRLSSDNIRRLLHIIDGAERSGAPNGLFFLDAQNAFDRLEWRYLWRVLKEFKFGPNFIRMVQILYSNPSARVFTGGISSEPFGIFRGTRQGCPLSPLLFNLSIEPLAQCIRQNNILTPISLGSSKHSISLYADDALIYISNIQPSLQEVMHILSNFGKLAGFKINFKKSVLMLLNVDQNELTLPADIVVAKQVTYLGVQVTSSVSTIVKNNYNCILKKIENDLNRWMPLPSSVPARISIVKMNVLPRINFISSMLPLSPPVGYWKKLDSLLKSFIWNKRRPRIKWSALQLPKSQGGWALPNFRLYQWSFTLQHLKHWLDPEARTSWIEIERDLVAPMRLQDYLFSGASSRQSSLRRGPIISYLLTTFRAVEKYIGVTAKWHKNSPLWFNQGLLSGNKPFTPGPWVDKGIYVLNDINGVDSLLSFCDLITQYDVPKHSLFHFLKLRSALKSHNIHWGSNLKMHPIVEKIQRAPRRIVSFLYLFLCAHSKHSDNLNKEWKRDLGNPQEDLDWEAIWDNVTGSSKNPNHQFIHLNICYRTYLTPRKRHLMGLAPHSYCTFCPFGTVGTFMHSMWNCPDVVSFWSNVVDIISTLTNIDFPMDPALHLLLDDSRFPITEKTRKLWLAGITAAKKLVVQRWLPPHDLSLKHWLYTLLDILYMELSSARINHAKEATVNNWLNAIEMVKELLSQ